ncbi:MAG: Ca2+-binding RTX toxin-like protein [Ilumatobacter sp.]|jgi:Ca2+-binding RTX toxin-like protein
MSLLSAALLVIVGAIATTTSGEVAAAHINSIAVTPVTVFPAFDEDTFDYAMRCAGGVNALDIVVDSPAATAITIDGHAVASGASTPVSVSANDLTVVAVTESGVTDEYFYRCLPDDFPAYTIDIPGTPGPGYYLVGFGLCFSTCPTTGGNFIAILDTKGVPVWYQRTRRAFLDQKLRSDGNIAIYESSGLGRDGYQINTLDGTLVDRVQYDGLPTDNHELLALANGNDMVLSYPRRTGVDLTALGLGPNETAIDGYIQEVDPDGNGVWEWRSQDHIAPEENHILDTDLVHLNSVDEFPDGDLLVSGRSTGVYRIDRTTGAVEWKLGGTATPESLTLIGDQHNGPIRQHDARVLPDGTITIFDNRQPGEIGRVVRYEIDTAAVPPTAKLLWEYEHADDLFSGFMGSARLQDDGNTVINWGGTAPMVEEIDVNGARQFVITGAGEQQYRVVKYPLATFDIATLRAKAGGTAETDAPLNVTAVAGNREATVSWDAPVAGQSITGYTAKSGVHSCTTTGATSCVITGLAAGESYSFVVRATNSYGTSFASMPSDDVIAGPTCNGLTVTVDLQAGQAPTSGNDVVLGTSAADWIDAGAGNDTVCAGGGADTIFGRAGVDTIFGEAGDDVILGSTGDDILNGGDGEDILNGQEDHDTINGDDGDDILYGLDGDDTLNGGDGNDRLTGHSGADTLDGGDGNDRLNGNEGNDIMHGRNGLDTLNGGDDDDKLYGNNNADTLNGGTGNDVLVGGYGDDTLNGGDGEDILNGHGNNDTLNGDDGDDILYGLDGDDTLNGGDGNDRLAGHSGADTLDGGDGNDRLNGNEGNDTLFGGNGLDTLNGGDDDDKLFGNNHPDTINGGDGEDVLVGGHGSDKLNGGDGNDTLNGQGQDDTLNGDGGNDTLHGLDGNDTLNGGDGDDRLRGWDGDDTLVGGLGADELGGGAGSADSCDGSVDADADVHLGGCEAIFNIP